MYSCKVDFSSWKINYFFFLQDWYQPKQITIDLKRRFHASTYFMLRRVSISITKTEYLSVSYRGWKLHNLTQVKENKRRRAGQVNEKHIHAIKDKINMYVPCGVFIFSWCHINSYLILNLIFLNILLNHKIFHKLLIYLQSSNWV